MARRRLSADTSPQCALRPLCGSGRWQTIEFDQAIDEIVNGGDLFGEGQVDGLKNIFVLSDADLAEEIADDVKGDDRRSKGVCPNAANDLDEGMKTTCLTDPIGGRSSFYDTKVNLIKV